MVKPKVKGELPVYDPEYKLRIIRMALEKEIGAPDIKKTFGLSNSTWYRWKKLYQEGGEEAIRRDGTTQSRRKPAALTPAEQKLQAQVLATKQQYPFFGVGRIWHWLRRTMFLPISHRFVRKTLSEHNLLEPPQKKKRQPPKPKAFERARPNQLWQSDITAFQIAKGLRVYLIGFMDDHSRYMVGWGLYAGQSGGLVLEVFRNAISTYGRPEEVLTDNGRQYRSWQGITDFQRELQREGIKHITSRPHHPQTLGKIEGFWGHMKREFLRRVVMGGLEDMRERMGHWINYYNFQRPNQGIDNATPAERFFKFSQVAREEIERRIRKNEMDLAFGDPPSRKVIGTSAIGDQPVEVRKEGSEFIVLLGDREVNRTDLDSRKEAAREAKEKSAVEAGERGQGGQGEGRGGAGSAVRREDDLQGLSGVGAQADRLLQTGGADGPGDAGGGVDAAQERKAPGSGGGSIVAGGGNGDPAPGAPAAFGPDEGVEQTLPDSPEEDETGETAEDGADIEPGGENSPAVDPGIGEE